MPRFALSFLTESWSGMYRQGLVAEEGYLEVPGELVGVGGDG